MGHQTVLSVLPRPQWGAVNKSAPCPVAVALHTLSPITENGGADTLEYTKKQNTRTGEAKATIK